MPKYEVVRYFIAGHRSRVIKRNLTHEQALSHVRSPETASSTARSRAARELTRKMGPWYDGYREDKSNA